MEAARNYRVPGNVISLGHFVEQVERVLDSAAFAVHGYERVG